MLILSLIIKHLAKNDGNLDLLSPKYVNFIFLEDFNSELCEQPMRDFFHVFNCQNIIKDKTCFKNPHNSSCIDLVVTNRPKETLIETGLSFLRKQVFHMSTK